MLTSPQNNTLPSLAFDSLRFAVRTIQRTTSAATVHGDPVVYINWLADKEGHGLTVAEYREFIDAMEVGLCGDVWQALQVLTLRSGRHQTRT